MSHYFESPAEGTSRPVSYDFCFEERMLTIGSDSGVFSHRHLDKATGHLLHYLETHISEIRVQLPDGDLIDLGCGAGPLAIAMASAFPNRRIWAIDVNERALELTRSNAAKNKLSNVVVATPDDASLPSRFAMLWSNPPIRIGKEQLHRLLNLWLPSVDPHGFAYMVVSKNLGGDSLQSWLNMNGFDTERVASKSGFRVLRTRNLSN